MLRFVGGALARPGFPEGMRRPLRYVAPRPDALVTIVRIAAHPPLIESTAKWKG